MKDYLFLAFGFALLLLPAAVHAANPVISNLTASQRPGTKLVDITYDVTADTPTVSVSLRISSDGGATFNVPATTLSGAAGGVVAVGPDRVVTWDAGADWLGNYSTATRFEITADAPDEFAYVAAGALPGDSWAGSQGVGAFVMGKTEVTWSAFQSVRIWAAANGYDIGSVGVGSGPNRPVTWVNWYSALKWCNSRSEKENLTPVYMVGAAVYRTGNSVPTIDTTANGYRLPSEKEWEFATRGGVNTNDYEYSGSSDINAVAWYAFNSGGGTKDVATKQANELGLSDTAGNVWEWCFDISSGDYRVKRGGGWGSLAYLCGVAFRGDSHSASSSSDSGFRVARNSVLPGSPSLDTTGSVSIDTRSDVSTMTDLALSTGTLSPTFAPTTTSYTASVTTGTASVTLTPTVSNSTATVKVNGVTVTSGAASAAIPLAAGSNTLTTVVTAQNATTVTTYTVVVTYIPPSYPLFNAAETALPLIDAGLVTLEAINRFSVVTGAASHDGVNALKITAVDGRTTYAERTVVGPSVVSFWWRVGSEEGYDFWSYSVNGAQQQAISGNGSWLYRSFTLPSGTHHIRWNYTKDSSDFSFDDAGYLDDLVIVDAFQDLQVTVSGEVVTGNSTLDFGSVQQPTADVSRSIMLKNNGTIPLSVTATLPTNSGFAFANGSLTQPLTMNAGQQSTLEIKMLTAAGGQKSALLGLAAPDSRSAPPAITLSGFVQPIGSVIACSWSGGALVSGQGTAVDFDTAPSDLIFTVANTGTSVMTISSVSISPPENFQVTSQPAPSVSVGGTTTFTVRAMDANRGNHLAILNVASDALNAPGFTIPLASESLLAVEGSGIVFGSLVNSGTTAGWDSATTVLPDGNTNLAIKTGATPHNGDSTIGATFDGPGILTWNWKVSSQQSFDWLLCEVNGVEVAGISTKTAVWQSQVIQIPAGSQVRWSYRKDAANVSGTDAGHLADIRFSKYTTAQSSFETWSAANGGIAPTQLIPAGGLQATFAWLGGVNPVTGPAAGSYQATLSGGIYQYRYRVDKSAAGMTQPQVSIDLTNWDSRRMRQTLLSEDSTSAVIELSLATTDKTFSRLVAEGPAYTPPPPPGFSLIPAGTFTMGDALDGDSDAPTHTVNVNAFYLAQNLVTKAEWDTVLVWAISNGYSDLVTGDGKAGNHPEADFFPLNC
jgi:formylglycine-generating enzyme required for sulfatase activity